MLVRKGLVHTFHMNTELLREFKFNPASISEGAVVDLWQKLLPYAPKYVIATLCSVEEFRVTVHPRYLLLWNSNGNIVYAATCEEIMYRPKLI